MHAMNINGVPTRSIWPVSAPASAHKPAPEGAAPAQRSVDIIDQSALPHTLRTARLRTLDDAAHAIRAMLVRGAPLIGVTAAYGVALALAERADDATLAAALATLGATRPTAVNLPWALARMQRRLARVAPAERAAVAWQEAQRMADEDAAQCRRIGEHGLALLAPYAAHKGTLNCMTHCNAGWLATVDYGTALAPVYAAHDAGLTVHVYVSETRPRNQGLLTAWELQQHGVPHTLIADNAAGALLARGAVDAVIVGADRVAANGDVANKVGTYLKALAADAASVPFFVAAPYSTIDFACPDGAAIPIEERDGEELRVVHGRDEHGAPATVRLLAAAGAVTNPAFDVTPAKLVSALITERGSCAASAAGLRALYPEKEHA